MSLLNLAYGLIESNSFQRRKAYLDLNVLKVVLNKSNPTKQEIFRKTESSNNEIEIKHTYTHTSKWVTVPKLEIIVIFIVSLRY